MAGLGFRVPGCVPKSEDGTMLKPRFCSLEYIEFRGEFFLRKRVQSDYEIEYLRKAAANYKI